ncbi:MAG TPA: ACT domain-containing protein [Oscillospiraceae bacterium]|jgi:ACT domain-containing protein|nr:ACT domain-containing protein [Oscillospiraceae bacterium]HPR40590.1 ACT domain-containing protein [Oscillospiraceae bacterium]HRW56870.1 ACT domain-containing protein [Oscillospiraceae bacterium]HXK77879.1 ACT domain-containing protein [Oscillospiraceae bacterium]
MNAIITVVAKDAVGIIAYISGFLSEKNINIMDISQTILQQYFTMIMLVDLSKCSAPFDELRTSLQEAGDKKGLVVHIQREDIFNAMHKI